MTANRTCLAGFKTTVRCCYFSVYSWWGFFFADRCFYVSSSLKLVFLILGYGCYSKWSDVLVSDLLRLILLRS